MDFLKIHRVKERGLVMEVMEVMEVMMVMMVMMVLDTIFLRLSGDYEKSLELTEISIHFDFIGTL
jgi:hypothetical protein